MKKLLLLLPLLSLMLMAASHDVNSHDFSESFINQSGTLPTTTLFTAPADRDYIVTLYLENTSSVPVGTIQASLSWTDDVQTRQVSVNAATSTNQSSSGIFSAHIKSGQSLVLDASDLTMSGQTYTVYVTAQSKTLD